MEQTSTSDNTPATTPASTPVETPAGSPIPLLSDIGKINRVYQFKLTLEDRVEHKEPRIWRRVLIPEDYTFYDFHQAILDAMDFGNCDCNHTHEFMMEDVNRPKAFYLDENQKICPNPEFDKYFKSKKSGEFKDSGEELPDQGYFSNTNIDETRYCSRDIKIADHFIKPMVKAAYCYDQIYCWDIEVEMEKILPATPGVEYPRCIDGQIASPPEHGNDNDWEEFKQTCRNFNFKTIKFQRAKRRMLISKSSK